MARRREPRRASVRRGRPTVDLARAAQRERTRDHEVARGVRPRPGVRSTAARASRERRGGARARHDDGDDGLPPLLVGQPDDDDLARAVRAPPRPRRGRLGAAGDEHVVGPAEHRQPAVVQAAEVGRAQPAAARRGARTASASIGRPAYPSASTGPASRTRPSSSMPDVDAVERDAVVHAAAARLGHAVGRDDARRPPPAPARAGPAPVAAPPTRTASNVRRASRARGVVEQADQLGGHERRVPRAGRRAGRRRRDERRRRGTGRRAARPASVPASTDRTSTCSPATCCRRQREQPAPRARRAGRRSRRPRRAAPPRRAARPRGVAGRAGGADHDARPRRHDRSARAPAAGADRGARAVERRRQRREQGVGARGDVAQGPAHRTRVGAAPTRRSGEPTAGSRPVECRGGPTPEGAPRAHCPHPRPSPAGAARRRRRPRCRCWPPAAVGRPRRPPRRRT